MAQPSDYSSPGRVNTVLRKGRAAIIVGCNSIFVYSSLMLATATHTIFPFLSLYNLNHHSHRVKQSTNLR